MAPGASYFCVYNVGTDSPVSQTDSVGQLGDKPVTMVWPSEQKARRHAHSLNVEYGLIRPELQPQMRTWTVRPATDYEIARARRHGALGIDYEDVIGTGQARPSGVKPRDPATGDGDEIERFRDKLDNQ